MTKKKYDAKFKSSIAIEAIKNKKSFTELAAENKIPKSNIKEWQDKLLNNASSLFSGDSELNKRAKDLEKEIENLHNIIGKITVEHNYLKKKYLTLTQK